MFKKSILFIMLACLTFFCMVPVKAQDAAISQPKMSMTPAELTAKAEKGDTDAQFMLGTLYRSGNGVEKDRQKGAYWLKKAAEGGNVEAAFSMIRIYAFGEGVPKDEQKAAAMLMQSAELGHPLAQCVLYATYLEDFETFLQDYRKETHLLDEELRFSLDMLIRIISTMRHAGIVPDNQKALSWLHKTAEQGKELAQLVLYAAYLEDFETLLHDYPQKKHLLDEELRFSLDMLIRIISSTRHAGIVPDNQKALSWLHKAAEQGHPRAQLVLYAAYLEDFETLLQDYRKETHQLDEKSRFFLDMLMRIISSTRYAGIVPDNQKALSWLHKAGEQGFSLAYEILADHYTKGFLLEQDDTKAAYWLEKVAELGEPDAQLRLGNMYADGRGVPRDDAKAIYWYQKAADQNAVSAQFNLGLAYYHGRGVPRNYERAAYWYRKAAERGFAIAQNELAVLYMRGDGVPRNYQKAFYWRQKAARQGYPEAQLNLGRMYVTGQGTKINYLYAYVLSNQAAVTLDSARELLDLLEKVMTQKEIAKAQAMTIDDVLR